MESLMIKGSDNSPTVAFDTEKGDLEMRGVAIPENVKTMFLPIMSWIDNYIKHPREKTNLTLFFDYLNTASSKIVYQICKKLSDIHSESSKVLITWQYVRGDVEMLEAGEEILDLLSCEKEIIVIDKTV